MPGFKRTLLCDSNLTKELEAALKAEGYDYIDISVRAWGSEYIWECETKDTAPYPNDEFPGLASTLRTLGVKVIEGRTI